MRCDFCNNPIARRARLYSPDEFALAVKLGLRPEALLNRIVDLNERTGGGQLGRRSEVEYNRLADLPGL